MADQCEFCANFVSDDEFGDYCNINLDEDEMLHGCNFYLKIY